MIMFYSELISTTFGVQNLNAQCRGNYFQITKRIHKKRNGKC